MATNPLPVGTRNFPVNMPEEMRLKLGRLATMRDRAGGALVRDLIADAIEQAEQRGVELARDVRQLLMPWALCFVAAAGIGCAVLRAVIGENELRRPQAVRTVRTVRAKRRDERSPWLTLEEV
jgi:predicted DNA-binding protein